MLQALSSLGTRISTTTDTDTVFRRAGSAALAAMSLLLAVLVVPWPALAPGACSPTGAGRLACETLKTVLPFTTSVALVTVAVYGAAVAALTLLPRLLHRPIGAAERLTTDTTPLPAPLTRSQPRSMEPEISRSFQPVALQGGQALHVCGQCLAVIEGDASAVSVACPACGARSLRRHTTRARVSRSPGRDGRSALPARVVLLSGGLDERSLGRVETAVTRRPEDPRRIVVLQITAGETVRPVAVRTLQRANASAVRNGGQLILSSPDAAVREALRETGAPVATSTSQAMELAAAFAPQAPELDADATVGPRFALRR